MKKERNWLVPLLCIGVLGTAACDRSSNEDVADYAAGANESAAADEEQQAESTKAE